MDLTGKLALLEFLWCGLFSTGPRCAGRAAALVATSLLIAQQIAEIKVEGTRLIPVFMIPAGEDDGVD